MGSCLLDIDADVSMALRKSVSFSQSWGSLVDRVRGGSLVSQCHSGNMAQLLPSDSTKHFHVCLYWRFSVGRGQLHEVQGTKFPESL